MEKLAANRMWAKKQGNKLWFSRKMLSYFGRSACAAALVPVILCLSL